MKNDFTPSIPAMNHHSRRTPRRANSDQGLHHPRRSTVMFIRQFARAYSCTPSLPPSLGAFIAN